MSLHLHLESLEPRLAMTAGLTASLTNGLLAIAGTSDADSITVQYTAANVSIVELGQSFALKQVRSISIATGDDDDTVQFSYIGTGANRWIGVVVSVQAEGGGDQFISPGGQSIYLGGLDLLGIDRKGKAYLNGKAPTWFDQTIVDPELRSLVKQEYADRVLSRADMLALFDQVSEDNTVGAGQLADLQAIVNNKALFQKLTYVQVLSGYVVNGTPANAFFQGNTLGNLTASSSGEQLTKLVDKWFLGEDHPEAEDLDTHEVFNYHTAAGTLFVGNISYADIEQGALGDCYLLAGAAALAVQSPKSILNMFVVNGDGTYTLRFYNGATPYFITVDSQLPTDSSGRLMFASYGAQYNDPNNELWVPLLEKAYAQLAEFGWLNTFGPVSNVNAYGAIDTGYPSDVLAQITGKSVYDSLILNAPSLISAAFAGGHAVTFITVDHPPSPDVVENHAYAMLGYNSKTREFVLFNPWGLNNGDAPAILRLTWAQLQANFYSWDYGPKV